jgi:hypothetical protein
MSLLLRSLTFCVRFSGAPDADDDDDLFPMPAAAQPKPAAAATKKSSLFDGTFLPLPPKHMRFSNEATSFARCCLREAHSVHFCIRSFVFVCR